MPNAVSGLNVDLVQSEGIYRCVYVNVEGEQAAREDVEQVMRTIMGELALRALSTLDNGFLDASRTAEQDLANASLIYGGDRAYRRNGVAVRPWFAI